MTQEEKQLLLIDLCARLPYGVKLDNGLKLRSIDTLTQIVSCSGSDKKIDCIKPYLRPMPSMTDEETDRMWEIYESGPAAESSVAVTEYLYGRYLDCHHLIENGLALIAPEGMYKIE